MVASLLCGKGVPWLHALLGANKNFRAGLRASPQSHLLRIFITTHHIR